MTTSSEKVSEPSMDDILASIRKIIAEEPTRAPVISRHAVPPKAVVSSTKPAPSPGPSAPVALPTNALPNEPAPSAPRAASSLAARINGQVAPASPAAASRASLTGSIASAAAKTGKDAIAIDDLLDDLADPEPNPAPEAMAAPAEPEPTRPSPSPTKATVAATSATSTMEAAATPVRSLFSALPAPADAPVGRSDGEAARRPVPPLFDNSLTRSDSAAPSIDLGAGVPVRDAASASMAGSPAPVPAPPPASEQASPADDAASGPDIALSVTPRSIVAPGLPRLSEPSVPSASDDNGLRIGAAAMAATAAVTPTPVRGLGSPVGPGAEATPVGPAAPAAPVSPVGGAPSHVGALPLAAPVRTLEETVSDLLRPMIRQWLDQNMPRIVERALKIEVASVTATERDKGPTGRSA